MSFVANPRTPAPASNPEKTVTNDGFFPDIVPADVRAAARITSTVTPDRLRAAILGAVMAAEEDLRAWSADRRREGFATLAAVPAPELDGKSVQVVRYHRAIELLTKAEVVERYRDLDTTGAGDRKADVMDPSAAELRADATAAIRSILGRTKTTVELI